jgi:hypothetical protein
MIIMVTIKMMVVNGIDDNTSDNDDVHQNRWQQKIY